MKLINILLEEAVNPVTIKWGELTVAKLRELGFDRLLSGITLPAEVGEYKLVWGAAIVAQPGSREEAAAMRSAEAKLARYKEDIEKRFDINSDTEVAFDENGVATIEEVEPMSPEDIEKRNDAYADLQARAMKKGNWPAD